MDKNLFLRGRWSPATRAAYASGWNDFIAWCDERSLVPLPAKPETIAAYLEARADTLSTSSLSQRLAAIIAVHALKRRVVNVKGSVIRDTWAEIRRRKGTAKTPKAALTIEDIRNIVALMPDEHVQDRAIVLCAFASLMRRSELVALNVDDLAFDDDALNITIRRSKTDKAGRGEIVAIRRTGSEFCPVGALELWIRAAAIGEGPVFRNKRGRRLAAREVANIAKRWGKNAGYDPAVIAAHSFRRGGITTMFRNGAKIEDIMKASRHQTVNVALGYVEAHRAAQNPAIALLGL